MKYLVLFIVAVLAGCSMIPKKVDPLNDPDTFSASDLNHNGVLAFVPQYDMNTDARIEMDLYNSDSSKTYRLSLTPALKSYSTVSVLGKEVHRSEVSRSEISDTVALFSLPPGKYLTKYMYAYFGDKHVAKGSVSENEIMIDANRITSLGNTLITFKAGLFSATIPSLTTVDTNTVHLIKACKAPLSEMNIRHVSVDAKAK